jgi:hypothetical protein
VSKPDHPLVRGYHRLLVWDMMSRPTILRAAESVLNPLLGKSVAMYFQKRPALQEPGVCVAGA